jgi:hypothetical protein
MPNSAPQYLPLYNLTLTARPNSLIYRICTPHRRSPLIYRIFTFFTFVTRSFKTYSRQKIARATSRASRRQTHSVYKKTHSTESRIPLLPDQPAQSNLLRTLHPLRRLRQSAASFISSDPLQSPSVVQLLCTYVQITLTPFSPQASHLLVLTRVSHKSAQFYCADNVTTLPKPKCSKPKHIQPSSASHTAGPICKLTSPSNEADISSQNPRLSDAKRNFSLTPEPRLARFFSTFYFATSQPR